MDEQKIVIAVNSSMNNAGRPFLRVNLKDDRERTIIEGRVGLHNMVVVMCGVFLFFMLSNPGRYVPGVLLVMLAIIGGGYIAERRRLLGAFAKCLGVGIGDLQRRKGV